jgi:hypothetical protein
MPDETWRAFDSVAPFDPNVLHRFVVWADPAPRALSPAEVKALGDPFASLLLARGQIPLACTLGRPLTAGMVTPDAADAAKFWRIERGDAEHTLRARFESRREGVRRRRHRGRRARIQFGGQVADRVQVWIAAVVKKGQPQAQAETPAGSRPRCLSGRSESGAAQRPRAGPEPRRRS